MKTATKTTLREAMGLGHAMAHTGRRKPAASADMEQLPLPSVRRFKTDAELMQVAADIVSEHWDEKVASHIIGDLIVRGVAPDIAYAIVYDKLGDASNLRWEAENGKGEVDYDEYQQAYEDAMTDLHIAIAE